ncbi:MAG TPA: hypothetical protein VHR66_33095 [Gemmataceae bacterium]|jgi:hypothetical protein|nr:hypothetical protein [Gemmataceae bacterium]
MTQATLNSPTDTSASAWIGWRREGGQRWRAVAEGANERECNERLDALRLNERAKHTSWVVLRAGERP